jgi:hypothetical protein
MELIMNHTWFNDEEPDDKAMMEQEFKSITQAMTPEEKLEFLR